MPRTTYETFTTSQDIKNDAWFERNTNIESSDVDIHRERAYSEIISILWSIYAIPDLDDTNFVWSLAHKWLASVELLMWGGYLLIKEYGEQARDTDKDGFRRVKDARNMLRDLQLQKVVLFWMDMKTLPLATETAISESGWIEWSENPDPTFSVNQEF